MLVSKDMPIWRARTDRKAVVRARRSGALFDAVRCRRPKRSRHQRPGIGRPTAAGVGGTPLGARTGSSGAPAASPADSNG